MSLEGMLADQRQRVGGNVGGLAGYDFEIRQVIGRRQRIRRHHHRQIAKAGILGQHREEGIHHARTEPFAEHDAVDIAGVEMLRRGFDRERADHADPLAERYRKRRIGGAAADQQHGGVAGRIEVGCVARASGSPSMRRITVICECANPQAGAQPRRQAIEAAAGLGKWNGVVGQRCRGIDRDQRQIGPLRGDLSARASRSGSAVPAIATRTAAGCNCSTARDASAQPASIIGNIWASSSVLANDGRPAVDTTMSGPCWDIWQLG